jgi:colicin import membrane protein
MEGTMWSLYQRQAPRFQLTRGMMLSLVIHVLVGVFTIVLPGLHSKRSIPLPFYTVDLVSMDQAGLAGDAGTAPGAKGKPAAAKTSSSKGHSPIPVMPVERLRAQAASTPVTPLKKLDSAVEADRSPKASSGVIDKTLDKLIPKPKQEKEPPPTKAAEGDKKSSSAAAAQGKDEDPGNSAKVSEQKSTGAAGSGAGSQTPGAAGSGAPGAAGGSAGGGDSAQIGLARRLYYAEVWSIIRREWALDTARLKGQHLEAVIVVVVRRDGKILSFHFEKKSGNALLDESAERAVRKVDSLPPFPKIYSPPQEEIGIRFRPEDLA